MTDNSVTKRSYNLPHFNDILQATCDSDEKADKVLKFISENRQRVDTCDDFKELVQEAVTSEELFVKLYVIFIYMIRDPVFFDDICRRLNDKAKECIRKKLDDIKQYILGMQNPISSEYNKEREHWKYHLGVYVHQIQFYCMCL